MTERADHLASLTRYKRWANNLVYSSLTQLSHRDLVAPNPIVFGSLVATLQHTLAMDEVWRAHLLGEPHGCTSRQPSESQPLETVRAEQTEMDDWYVNYADQLQNVALNEVVDFEFIGGGHGAMSREQILLHVVNHGTYHRGNVTAMLYQHGISPPTTDYPVFLRDAGQ